MTAAPIAMSLASIRTDGGTQVRAELDDVVVAEYAEAIAQGAAMPPIVVFCDGAHNWLADGFHRYWGHKKAGRESIVAEIRSGAMRDAVLFSVGANHDHGLRRSPEDKRSAVEKLLKDAEWSRWSDREIALACRVSHSFVGRIRHLDSNPDAAKRKFERDGKTLTMKTSSINAKRQKSAAQQSAEMAKNEQKEREAEIAATDEEARRIAAQALAENAELLSKVAQLSASDLGAELVKERELRKSAERSQGEAMDRAREFQKQLEQFGAWFGELRKLTRCDSNGDAMKVIRQALRVAA